MPDSTRHRPPRDGDALPVLVQVMSLAGLRDTTAILVALDLAEASLPTRNHQSRPAIAAARNAAVAGEWDTVWRAAHAATCTLTWAFPPDPATCPPLPSLLADTVADSRCPGCQTVQGVGARYCHACGTRQT